MSTECLGEARAAPTGSELPVSGGIQEEPGNWETHMPLPQLLAAEAKQTQENK